MSFSVSLGDETDDKKTASWEGGRLRVYGWFFDHMETLAPSGGGSGIIMEVVRALRSAIMPTNYSSRAVRTTGGA